MAAGEKLAKKEKAEVTRQEGIDEYFLPAVDISETNEDIILKYDMPGVDKGDVEITVEKNTLCVTGKVKASSFGDAVYQETRIGNYRREFTLPDDVDADSITAEMKDGVLTIRIQKPEKAKPKKIEIKSS